MGNTIFSKILASFLTMICIVFFILAITVYSLLGNFVTREKEENMITAGEKIAEMTNIVFINGVSDASQYYQFSIEIIARNLNCDIFVADDQGKILFHSSGINENISDFVIPSKLFGEVMRGIKSKEIGRYPVLSSKEVLLIGVPVKYNDAVVGGIYLFNAVPELANLRKDIFGVYLVAAFFALFLAVIIIFYISKKFTEPITAITKAAHAISLGDFSTRVKVYKDDEIGELATSFNNMAESIEKQEIARSSFVSDVSHELRTPMTTITGFVEGILDETIPDDKRNFYLKIVLDESKRLSKLVSDLLDVSRLDSDESKLEISVFDINELIRLSIIGLDKRLSDKNLTVNALFENESQLVAAEKDSIKRVVTNLLDNAVKFCNPGGTIEISTFQKGERVFIGVKNTGDGIPKEQLKTIFNRFYKLDKSRSQNKSGVGLGLYIVKAIISKHKQYIKVESIEGEYAMFTFTLQKAK